MNQEEGSKLTKNINKKTKRVLIAFVVFVLVIFLGNYHIVLDATDLLRGSIFIKRPYFGFSDIIGSTNNCTNAPYYSVMLNHPSLCRALQNAGYLESEEARKKRIEQEVEDIIQGVTEQTKQAIESTKEAQKEEKIEQEVSVEEINRATLGEKNSLRKATDYLNYTAFSYEGLVNQLKFEGFSDKEAKYGADHCGANWNEQAAKTAKNYVNLMAFSRSGLIDQLKFAGFTSDQAEYGAQAVGY